MFDEKRRVGSAQLFPTNQFTRPANPVSPFTTIGSPQYQNPITDFTRIGAPQYQGRSFGPLRPPVPEVDQPLTTPFTPFTTIGSPQYQQPPQNPFTSIGAPQYQTASESGRALQDRPWPPAQTMGQRALLDQMFSQSSGFAYGMSGTPREAVRSQSPVNPITEGQAGQQAYGLSGFPSHIGPPTQTMGQRALLDRGLAQTPVESGPQGNQQSQYGGYVPAAGSSNSMQAFKDLGQLAMQASGQLAQYFSSPPPLAAGTEVPKSPSASAQATRGSVNGGTQELVTPGNRVVASVNSNPMMPAGSSNEATSRFNELLPNLAGSRPGVQQAASDYVNRYDGRFSNPMLSAAEKEAIATQAAARWMDPVNDPTGLRGRFGPGGALNPNGAYAQTGKNWYERLSAQEKYGYGPGDRSPERAAKAAASYRLRDSRWGPKKGDPGRAEWEARNKQRREEKAAARKQLVQERLARRGRGPAAATVNAPVQNPIASVFEPGAPNTAENLAVKDQARATNIESSPTLQALGVTQDMDPKAFSNRLLAGMDKYDIDPVSAQAVFNHIKTYSPTKDQKTPFDGSGILGEDILASIWNLPQDTPNEKLADLFQQYKTEVESRRKYTQNQMMHSTGYPGM